MDVQQPASSPDPVQPEELEVEEVTPAPTEQGRRSRGSEGVLFFVLGSLLAVFGVALAAAPEFSWHLTKIGRALAAAGVESGILIVGGLVFAGLGQVARRSDHPVAVVEAPQTPQENEEFRLLVDQLTAQFSQLRTSTLQIAEDIAGISEVQKVLFHKLDDKDDLAQQHRDALFRLAASLDKLNAHVDERIHALDLQVRSGLDGMLQAIGQARHQLECRIDALSSPSESKMSPPPGFTSRSPENELHVLVDLEDQPAATPSAPFTEAGDDFFGTTLERLDEISGEAGDSNPPGPMPASGEGTLDIKQSPEPGK